MKETIRFRKMHGLGNDFIVIDAVNQDIQLNARQIRALSDRRTGIGFDQCLIVGQSDEPDIDFSYRIFNADGMEVGQCGNGARCLAVFIKKEGLSDKKVLTVKTETSILKLKIMDNGNVMVDMGEPRLAPKDIPLDAPHQADYYTFELDDEQHYLHALSVGNPHGILVVPELNNRLVQTLGLKLSQHPKFLEGANISFMQIDNSNNITLRVYERGVGETHACGSAAVAASVCAMLYHQCHKQVNVSLPGGQLSVNWEGIGSPVLFSGPAKSVFEGSVQV